MPMNCRARRIALLTVAAGCLVVAGLVVAHWGTVRDHVEAWRFQLTRETATIEPAPALRDMETLIEYSTTVPQNGAKGVNYEYWPDAFLNALANYDSCPVIFELGGLADLPSLQTPDPVTAERARDFLLRIWACRILDQRFPRRAYVVTGYPAR